MPSSSKRRATSSKDARRINQFAEASADNKGPEEVVTVDLQLRNHVEDEVVEVTLPTKPRLTLCLSPDMTLGEAAAKITARYRKVRKP